MTTQPTLAPAVFASKCTGKSVIAVHLVAELAERGLSTLHVTGSKAFTENLRKIVGARASALFRYFSDTANVSEPLDVVIVDEAHRIRSVSTSRFTPPKARTGRRGHGRGTRRRIIDHYPASSLRRQPALTSALLRPKVRILSVPEEDLSHGSRSIDTAQG